MGIDWIQAIVTGAISSLGASIIFFVGMRQLRPKVDIAPKISFLPGFEGNHVHQVKLINQRARIAQNMTVEFLYRWKEIHQDSDGKAQEITVEKTARPPRSIVAVAPKERWWVRRKAHDNCVRVWIDDAGAGVSNFQGQWEAIKLVNPTAVFVVRSVTTDGVSGVSGSSTWEYGHYDDAVVAGSYRKGHTFDITPASASRNTTSVDRPLPFAPVGSE